MILESVLWLPGKLYPLVSSIISSHVGILRNLNFCLNLLCWNFCRSLWHFVGRGIHSSHKRSWSANWCIIEYYSLKFVHCNRRTKKPQQLSPCKSRRAKWGFNNNGKLIRPNWWNSLGFNVTRKHDITFCENKMYVDLIILIICRFNYIFVWIVFLAARQRFVCAQDMLQCL